MNDFYYCNKVTGIYWLKKPLENLQIKITLKHQDSIISLPRFEEYTNKTDTNFENTPEEHIFKWQEKVYSCADLQRYSDIHNCFTDIEMKYHDIIENGDVKQSKVFSYIHEDFHLPLHFKKPKQSWNSLGFKLEQLSLNDSVKALFSKDTVSTQHLFKSNEDIDMEEQEWIAMHIVFDNSEYSEDSQLIFKQEVTLLSIYHNILHNFVIVTPDLNKLELNPYVVETTSGVPCGYQYSVDIEFEEEVCNEEMVFLLKKLLKKWEKRQRHLLNFSLPPLGRRHYLVTLELLTATGFEMDNLYIEFDIKVPESVQCTEQLHGRTHTAKVVTIEDVHQWNFAHIIELSLEIESDAEPAPIRLFLEVISKDWWCRHRTEGYAYVPIHLNPGRYSKEIDCCRPEELNAVEAESRRFFVGGCHLIKDLEVLANPAKQNANFRYVATGQISLRWSIISQSRAPGVLPSVPQPGTSAATALLQGAEVALRKYRKARARLAAATKDMSVPNTSAIEDG